MQIEGNSLYESGVDKEKKKAFITILITNFIITKIVRGEHHLFPSSYFHGQQDNEWSH